MPVVKKLHLLRNTNYAVKPTFHQAADLFSHSQVVVVQQLQSTEHMPWDVSLGHLLLVLFILGAAWQLVLYARSLLQLRQLQHAAFRLHQIKRIHILFTEHTTPFCWSWFNQHLIVLPNQLLENSTDKHIAIRHELQHLRQGDTQWLHIFNSLNVMCYWNPFFKLWKNYFNELQEFACDEAVILRNTSPILYAQCLVNSANQMNLAMHSSIALHGISTSLLYRRINMVFQYKTRQRTLSAVIAYTICLIGITSAAYAVNNNSPITVRDVERVIEKTTPNDLVIRATPEVVAELNRIKTNDKTHSYIVNGLKRMPSYQALIQQQLTAKHMPMDLLAMPLLQSAYQPLDQSKNHVAAAGIWQIIPATARHFGLSITNNRDDRLDTQLSTTAALTYLDNMHTQFGDWKLAVVGYEIGEKATEQLIKRTGSRDAWTLARSPLAPKELKEYLAMYDATVIIIHKPSLING